jgi:hypothetical protein
MSKIPKEVKELILARLDVMPNNIKLSIGSYGSFSKDQLKENVEKETEIGHKIVEMQLNFLRAVSNGELYNLIDIDR